MTIRLSDPQIGRKRRRHLTRAGVAAAMLVACATTGTPAPGGLDRDDWVSETLESLTLRERVGQLVMVWMTGAYASRTDEELVRIERLVTGQGIGGVVISLGTPHSYVARLNHLQSVAEVPLLVAADFESGPGFRVGGIYALPSGMDMGGATALPPAMAFGAVDDEGLAYEAGRITGLEARALGVHLNFAPVLDVNNNPDNPIINTRSFGEDPDRVAALGAAYIRGARAGGLMTTAKHFPGHGDTGTDSHLELPTIPGDRARLDAIELVPFRLAIEAGVDAIMTAHIAAPQILGPDGPPATLSPYFMTGLLREEMGFDGVLFTDALDMAAIEDGYGPGEAAVRALEAGADVLLMPPNPARAIDAVVAAVEAGRISEGRVEESVRRVLQMKSQAGLHVDRSVDPSGVTEVVGTEEHTAVADSVARRSLTLVRDLEGRFPIDTVASPGILSITYARDEDVAAGRAFDARLGEAVDVVRIRIDPDASGQALAGLGGRVRGADLVVLSTYATPTLDEGEPGPQALESLMSAIARTGAPILLVSFGSPYVTSTVRDPWAYLIAWSGAAASQRAAADALLGRISVGGRLPISLPPLYALGHGLARDRLVPGPSGVLVYGSEVAAAEVGMDSAALARVDRLVTSAIRDSVTPGAALAVGRHGRLVMLRGYGRLDWRAGAGQVTESTRYDLASLTKVIATTTALMKLVETGQIGLDAPVGDYLPEWAQGWKSGVTVRHLMLHRGGLPPFRPFWRDLRGREAYRDAISRVEADYPPGERTVYSDIGLITLQFVIESVTGEPLDVHVKRTVFDPLEMTNTMFNPPGDQWNTVAPTEVDTVFRQRHMRGEVHDENAFALGGVAGHAGLFSSAHDLARFAGWITAAARSGRGVGTDDETAGPTSTLGLLPGAGADPGLPAPATVAAFTTRADDQSSRALGWDTPSGRSSAGRFFGGASFGHTGFTGTSIWIDPELDLFVVLLTNRVNPTRAERGHIPLRRAVHDAVAISIADQPVQPRDRP